VVGEVVEDGRVDYGVLTDSPGELRSYAATLAQVGPESHPSRFPTEQARLAYYINAYNALVLLAVVEAWPIDSVHEVRAPLEPVAGFGFFWSQRFRLDGEVVSLYALENRILRHRFADARIHAAINCASASCPDLAPAAYHPESLDRQLEGAARAFCSDPRHVRVADDGAIELSAIFDWFRGDFEAHARREGLGTEVLDFVEAYADRDLQGRLVDARDGGAEVRTLDYDWSVNAR